MKTLILTSLLMAATAQAQISLPKQIDPKTLEMAKAVGSQIAEVCKHESVQFCKDKSMDKLKACLQDNYAKLSGGCKAALKAQDANK